ncbi:ABC transporter substrate-binding protein [Planctomonas psychrotolerans]|uniref:ABC transporter substrate-binding protein n=1 Tax=Planctomonas psychrotolerans TaxID=2528712 RepID=UPI00123B9FDB|nr:sugar ABC transporter substrate-binding protein [Planctomonas psychrotolerans]
MRSRRLIAAGAILALTGGLTACSAESRGGSDGPVTLTFWGWGVGYEDVIAEWNEANPDIQVEHTDAGGGDDSSAKLLTAARAGNAPDVALVEYTTLPAMIVADVPLDITEYVGDAEDAFTEGTWDQTRFDGAVYAIPQDVGPMALTYRQDRLEEMGLAVPTTWEEFGEVARGVKANDPNSVLTSLPPSELGFYAGVAAQAGSEWWSLEDGVWTVGIADEASLEVADFFEGLVKEGAISTEPLLTPEYNAKLNDGTMLSWPAGIWASGVFYGVAPDTAGNWAMAPLPQWTPGDAKVAYQGGSGMIVTKESEHPEEAAEFAKWFNASEDGNELLLSSRQVYPASIVGQEMAASSEPPALMPQQTTFYEEAAAISAETIPVTWGPNVNLAKMVFEDRLNKAIADGTPWRDAFIATQEAVVDDMKTSGYEVSND